MPIDYRDYLEEGEEGNLEEEERGEKEKKKFSLTGIKRVWFAYDKKTKIELIVLVVVLLLIAAVLIFSFGGSVGETPFEKLPAPPAE